MIKHQLNRPSDANYQLDPINNSYMTSNESKGHILLNPPLLPLKTLTQSYRSFNTSCLLVFLATAIFMMVFVEYMDHAQVSLYLIQLIFGFINIVFLVLNDRSEWKEAWVRNRRVTVYAVFALMNMLYLYDFYRFFMQLDYYYQKQEGGPAASTNVQDVQLTEAYVTIYLLHFIAAPFFQGLSFCLYVKEMGLYLDNPSSV